MAPRLLLITGKGGVGKTTTAAATAVACADAGRRTLVLSTDPAHSLADALGVALGDRPVSVAPNLWGQELDARRRLEEQWGELRGYLAKILDWAGVRAIEAEELTMLPGLDEVLALADLVDHAQDGLDGRPWDVIVIDCAPTAETLRLLSLPEILSWWMDRLFPLGRQVTRAVSPVMRQLTSVPIPEDATFAAAERLYRRLDAVRTLLGDHAHTTVRLVVNPERVVVAEARRTATYLALFGYRVDAVVANRMLPAAVTDPWFDRWRVVQARELTAIVEGFAPLPVLKGELQDDEPVGLDALRRLAVGVYGELDPAAHLFDGSLLDVEREPGGGWVLRLALPFTGRRDVGLSRRQGELLVTVGPYRRALVLPDTLVHRRVTDAVVRDGTLTVRFAAS